MNVLSILKKRLADESVCQEILLQANEGIVINGEVVNNIRYADDPVLVVRIVEELQRLLTNINIACNNYGININIKKNKYMVFSKT
ncbi:unnamed protein product [Diabrotica balteata]|uniref:Reverse transcriptase domain-containing protein n=1 Tax=Diabrotica balteata TaxID=107213 RepID=A0A9N9XKP3_DIABA|nr:unnamed protein product [Diabrotica balteata]